MNTIKKYQWLYLPLVLYFAFAITFSITNHFNKKQLQQQIIDQQLQQAALLAPTLLANSKDHKPQKLGQALDFYVQNSPISSLYVLAKQANELKLLSASQNLDFASISYPDSANNEDLFGTFFINGNHHRRFLTPYIASNGSQYILGADINLTQATFSFHDSLVRPFAYAFILWLLSTPLFAYIHHKHRKQQQKLTQRINQRTTELINSESRLNAIIEYSPVGIFHYDNDGNMLKTNKRIEEIVQANNNELNDFNIFKQVKNPKMIAAVKQSLAGQIAKYEDEYLSVTGGRLIHLRANLVPFYTADGKIDGGIGVFDDVTDLHQSNEDLKKLSRVVECSPDSIIIADKQGLIEYTNPKFSIITGYKAEEVIGKPIQLLRGQGQQSSFYADIWDKLLAGKEWYGELKNTKKNGEEFWSQGCILPLTDSKDQITHFIGIQVDVTKARIATQKVEYQATHDMLTGLLNRYEFEHRLNQLIRRTQNSGTTHALCFLDLDQFKIINDTCGHIAGDELLRQLSALLKENTRSRDTLARLGGDEFAIIMNDCSLEDAEKAGQKILDLVSKFQFLWKTNIFSIGVSIGITEICKYTNDTTEALIHADLACYAAKDLGRNRIHTYRTDDEILAQRDGEFRWVNELKDALAEDRFELYAQPIVSLSDPSHKKVYEVLLRLRSTEGKIIPPGAFLPAAERYNLSLPIDTWVVKNSLVWMHKNNARLDDLDHISINLSGPSLGSKVLLDFIMTEISEHDLDPTQIQFEITETAAITNLREATSFIKALRAFGCHFALDDFGSGLSSFAYLKNLPVSTLKIDGIFVKDIINNPIDEAMVKSINDIGHVMNMKTVAEFVENDLIKQRLQQLGIDYAQGYGLGVPAPIDNILA